MEALRRSVGATTETKAPKTPPKKARKATGQKEMLMPIEGQEVGEGDGGKEAVRQAAAEVCLVRPPPTCRNQAALAPVVPLLRRGEHCHGL